MDLLSAAVIGSILFLAWWIWSRRVTSSVSISRIFVSKHHLFPHKLNIAVLTSAMQNIPEKAVVKENANEYSSASYEEIEPLSNLNWQTTPPLKIWPFKPRYHLTMGECLVTL